MSLIALYLGARPAHGDQWVNIGPAPIHNSPWGDVSGRISSIAVDPGNSNHWLIGAADGGVWGTFDRGTTWTPLTDDQVSLAMGVIAFAPSNPNIIYAGTGDQLQLVGSYAGVGLLKSTNGGTTWQSLAASRFAGTSFSAIRVHPTDPAIVIATTSQGAEGTANFGLTSIPPRGIFKSTDGGVTWSQKGPTLSVDMLGRPIGDGTALEVDPTNFSHVYAAIGISFGAETNGVYRSNDAGETWTLISGPWSSLPAGVGRVALAIAPSNPTVLYVSIQDAYNGVGNDGGLLGLWRTDSAWDVTPTWTAIPTDATGSFGYCGLRCDNLLDIIVDPTDPNTLYASGVALWKCTTCGATPTWTDVTDGIHPDQRSEAWAGDRLIVGNDGGLYSTTDGGTTWTNHNTNLSITQFTAGCIHPNDENLALGGSIDNLYAKWTGTNAWQYIPENRFVTGDGRNCAFSSVSPDMDWELGLDRTLDGGISFTPGGVTSGIDFTQSGVPIFFPFGPVEKCPANDVFIGANSTAWRSSDFFSTANPSWSANSPVLDDPISTLAFAPHDATCSTYALGTQFGTHLLLTSNGGGTWVDIDASNAVPNRYVGDLAFDPTNSNILYVTLSDFDEGTPGQPGHVFKTINALAGAPTWSNVSPPVNVPHNSIAVDAGDPNTVYVGTDLGIWKSSNGAETWTHMGPESGMPNVAVYDIQINDTTNRVVAFTHGRGAFVLSTSTTTTTTATTSTTTSTIRSTTTTTGTTSSTTTSTSSTTTVTTRLTTTTSSSTTTTTRPPTSTTTRTTNTSTTTAPSTTTTSSTTTTAPPTGQCPLSTGFLKTHPAQWAVGSVTLGSEAYTQAELLTLLTTPVSGDASSILADQLIAAKLNLANGSSPTPIISTIANADSLLRGFAGKLPYEVRPNSAAGHAMIHDANVLAQYNGGALTPTCSAAALVDPSAAETLSIVAQIEAMETACAGGPVGLRRRLESPSDPRDDAAHVRIRWWRGRMEAQRAVRLAHEYVVEDERVKVPSLPG